jgi:hypothetical protein
MIVEPELRVADFAKAGADIISVHAEQSSTIHLHRVVNQIKELGCKAGVVLNPGTPLRRARATHFVSPYLSLLWKRPRGSRRRSLALHTLSLFTSSTPPPPPLTLSPHPPAKP